MKYLLISFLSIITFTINSTKTIDSTNSGVSFEITNLKVNTVKGSFSGMKGDIEFDENDLANSKFNVCVDASTVNTGSSGRDEHLLKEDFFNVNKNPTICFQSNFIKKVKGKFQTTGKLTMNGITKIVTIPFEYDGTNFKGDLKVNRFDYKVGEEYGTWTISSEATIKINCKVS